MSSLSLIAHWRYILVWSFASETSIILHSQVHPEVCLQSAIRSFASAAATSPLSLRIRSDVNGGNVSLTYNGASLEPCLCERKDKFLHVESVEMQPFWVTWQHIKCRWVVLLKLFTCSYTSVDLKQPLLPSKLDVNYCCNL